MKFLLSSIGSRGDVQPLIALASELRALGHTPVLCVAPNFQPWIESFGIDVVPIGPDLEAWSRAAASRPVGSPPSPEQRQQIARQSVAEQFRVMLQAAQGCDAILVGGMLQIAGRSIAEALGVSYVCAAYCPATLPSPDHPPATMGARHPQLLAAEENLQRWLADAQSFDATFGAALNEQRAALGLASVAHVARHITTARPWLAADPVLAPAGTPIDMAIWQSGAWLLADPTPLPEALERFLAAGEPPIYFGFGSMRADADTSQLLVGAARALGRRTILLRGWGNLDAVDNGDDVIAIGDVSHERLLRRVALAVHHGGAGTTTAVARAGRPQMIVPHLYDQYYWAHRVEMLGVGVEGPVMTELTVDKLANSLRACLVSDVVGRAEDLAGRMEQHGVRFAAERLISVVEKV
jgi:vancomycin aglycone glucosyltransferase